VGPRGFVVKAPVEFDSMGPHWVVHWIPGWAQLREKGGETSFHLRRSVNWEIERCCLWPGRHRRYILHGHGDVTPPPLDVKKGFSARTARPGSLFSRSKSIGCYYRVDPVSWAYYHSKGSYVDLTNEHQPISLRLVSNQGKMEVARFFPGEGPNPVAKTDLEKSPLCVPEISGPGFVFLSWWERTQRR
jgi:hypothetical protein